MPSYYSTEDFRRVARRRLPRMMFDFVEGGAGREYALARNEAAFAKRLLQPRVMVNVETRSLETSLLGRRWGLPFGIAPMGMCNLVWPDTDAMFAEVARSSNIPVGLSTAASTSIEDMATLADGHAWFQVYVSQTDELTFSMIERARKCGYETLVFTVDVPQVAPRIRDQRNGFGPKPKMGPRQILDFALHPAWSFATLQAGVPTPVNYPADGGFVREASRARVDWRYLQKVRDAWPGKLLVKGVLHPDDASRLAEAGVDGIYVSSHGGRQLDSAPAAIDALASIRSAVGEAFPIVFDSGVRSGEDIIKALACGADFVMLGRPFMYAAGANGQAGVERLVELLSAEIDVTLAQLGRTGVSDIDQSCLADV